WPELAGLIAGARAYVGPDTSVTHVAAATGTPTVALYGPTDPRLWGPWPSSGLAQPWEAAGTVQHRGNVWLVQNAPSCPFAIVPSFFIRFEDTGLAERFDGLLRFLPGFVIYAGLIYFLFGLHASKWRFTSLPDLYNIMRAATVLAVSLLVLDYILVSPQVY